MCVHKTDGLLAHLCGADASASLKCPQSVRPPCDSVRHFFLPSCHYFERSVLFFLFVARTNSSPSKRNCRSWECVDKEQVRKVTTLLLSGCFRGRIDCNFRPSRVLSIILLVRKFTRSHPKSIIQSVRCLKATWNFGHDYIASFLFESSSVYPPRRVFLLFLRFLRRLPTGARVCCLGVSATVFFLLFLPFEGGTFYFFPVFDL